MNTHQHYSRFIARLVRLVTLSSLLLTGCVSTPVPAGTSTPVDRPTTASTLPPTKTTVAPAPTRVQALPSPSPIPTEEPIAETVVQERVLPSPYLAPPIVQAPIAWTRSTGKGVTVAVTRNHDEDLALVNLIAPDAKVEPLTVDAQMNVAGKPLVDLLKQRNIRLLAIVNPSDFDPQILREATQSLTAAGVTVFINSDLTDQPEEQALIQELDAAGAITIGRLDIDGVPTGYGLQERPINLYAPFGFSFDRGAVLTAAGIGALVLAAEPTFSPEQLKQRLVRTADEKYAAIWPGTTEWNFSVVTVDPQTGDYAPTQQAFRLRRVNAARALGLRLEELWPVNALNAPFAWKTATGRGVKVAIIDQGFHVNNPAFKDHLVDQGAFFPGQDFTGEQNFHGTSMAKIVLAVAPDVSLMFLHNGESADLAGMAKAYAEAIDYAIEHHADVISSSAAPWPNTPEVHAAIDRAIAAGVVFVWFHYQGHNDAVIRPGHFWSSVWEVGAFDRFFDEDKPSNLEGGLSDTAPQIAGIAALILQNEPGLSPQQVKQRILETASVLPNGTSIADAAAAVANQPSGRQLASQGKAFPQDGFARVTYGQADSKQKTSVEISEQAQTWPIAAWSRQDILFYQAMSAGISLSLDHFLLKAYQDKSLFLTIRFSDTQALADESWARVSLMPAGNTEPSYFLIAGENQVPPVKVEINGDKVRLSWKSVEGAPLKLTDPETGLSGPSSYRLYSFEVETRQSPDLIQPLY
ncbi:Subtilisin DY [Thermoflexales bacterium]|nr:Subtilisin DY [Thermoflexales bacterium]